MLRSVEPGSAARRAVSARASTSASAIQVGTDFTGTLARRRRQVAARLQRLAHGHEAVTPEQPLQLVEDRVQVEIGDERCRGTEPRARQPGHALPGMEVERERALTRDPVDQRAE